MTPLRKALLRAHLETETLQKQLAFHCGYSLSKMSGIVRGAANPPRNFNEKAKEFFRQHGLETDFSREILMGKTSIRLTTLPKRNQKFIRRLIGIDFTKVSKESCNKLLAAIETLEKEQESGDGNRQ